MILVRAITKARQRNDKLFQPTFQREGKKKDISEFIFCGQLEKKINLPNTNTSPKVFLPGPWWLVLRMQVSGRENMTHHWVKGRSSPGWKSLSELGYAFTIRSLKWERRWSPINDSFSHTLRSPFNMINRPSFPWPSFGLQAVSGILEGSGSDSEDVSSTVPTYCPPGTQSN